MNSTLNIIKYICDTICNCESNTYNLFYESYRTGENTLKQNEKYSRKENKYGLLIQNKNLNNYMNDYQLHLYLKKWINNMQKYKTTNEMIINDKKCWIYFSENVCDSSNKNTYSDFLNYHKIYFNDDKNEFSDTIKNVVIVMTAFIHYNLDRMQLNCDTVESYICSIMGEINKSLIIFNINILSSIISIDGLSENTIYQILSDIMNFHNK